MSADSSIAPGAARLLLGRAGGLAIAAIGVLCTLSIAAASLRHAGSLTFPIDDGYIYSNYVLSASQGHFFTYNPGELSGGITGLGWYFISLLSYLLVTPLHALLANLGPAPIRSDPQLSAQAAHLYLAAWMPGTLLLIATGLGVRSLANLTLPAKTKPTLRAFICWLLGACAAADLGLTWGATSGLEVALSSALVVWALCWLVADYSRGSLRWSLLLGAALPLARPDLVVFGAAGLVWLLGRALLTHDSQSRRRGLTMAATYLLALLAGVGAMSLVYFVGWGRPLPSSFYAKVGGLRFGSRFFSAVDEVVIAGRALPFVAALLVVAGGVSGLLHRDSSAGAGAAHATRPAAALLLLGCAMYVGALMFTLPWFGQEDRYLLPVHGPALVLGGLLLWRIVALLPVEPLLSRRWATWALVALVAVVLAGGNYLWATRDYAVEVRNIIDGHIEPAAWLRDHEPTTSIVASEPIGAVKLFASQPTIDLVGLTTPATLGTYRNWPLAWEALRNAHVSLLVFYPAWFDGGHPPPWAVEKARFTIPDNRIVGDSTIAIYELRWQDYTPAP